MSKQTFKDCPAATVALVNLTQNTQISFPSKDAWSGVAASVISGNLTAMNDERVLVAFDAAGAEIGRWTLGEYLDEVKPASELQ